MEKATLLKSILWTFPNTGSPNSDPNQEDTTTADTPLTEREKSGISEELDRLLPFLATVINQDAIAVLGDFDREGQDEVRMFQLDIDLAERVEESWELMKQVKFAAGLVGLEVSHHLHNPEAFFGKVADKHVIIIIGDSDEEKANDKFYAFVEAPELLCRLGRPKTPQ